jgi:phage baseplate assembly protein W
MKKYSDLNLNFLAHPATGDLVKVKGDNSIKQAVKLLVLTKFYERAFRPEVGAVVSRLLFEPISPYTSFRIAQSIKDVLRDHEPRINVTAVTATPGEDEMSYSVSIEYTILNSANKATIQFLLKKS